MRLARDYKTDGLLLNPGVFLYQKNKERKKPQKLEADFQPQPTSEQF